MSAGMVWAPRRVEACPNSQGSKNKGPLASLASMPSSSMHAALRRSPWRQAVAVKDRHYYLETARQGRRSRVVQTARYGAVRIM